MSDPTRYDRYGWQSDLPTFSGAEPQVVRARLSEFVTDASPEQVRAWDQSIPWLQRECRELEVHDSNARTYTAVLEYELPRDFRRPDVIVLEHGCIVVLEIKGRPYVTQAALDQVAAYARDLRAYHAACAGRRVIPVLLTSGSSPEPIVQDGVYVLSPRGLSSLLADMSLREEPLVTPAEFLRDDVYAPLPTIVQAARDLFHHRPLPMIKRARASTDPALERISSIARHAAATKTRHLVLLSGVPGAGKTLVGLQLVHAGWLDELAVPRANGQTSVPAVYLSGNGPLVEVLQHALREDGAGGRTFVQAIKNYVAQHSRPGRPIPPEHLIVFDEAQRAHDADRVAKVHGRAVDKSEPEHLVEFCGRIPDWCVLVALIGSGQAIHVGEEKGTSLWVDAVRRAPIGHQWQAHGAPEFAALFANQGIQFSSNAELNLDTEIRYHLTPKLHDFVDKILTNADRVETNALADELHTGGHRLLLTRDLDVARAYLLERYADAPQAKYGILASSKDKWLLGHGVDNSFQTTKRLRVGPWYNADRKDPMSCCGLDTVATEFSSQGLELDMSLLAWGSDYIRSDGSWSMANSRGSRDLIHDPLAMRRNVYRVLLTRGRDGTVVFVPGQTELDETARYLMDLGFRQLVTC